MGWAGLAWNSLGLLLGDLDEIIVLVALIGRQGGWLAYNSFVWLGIAYGGWWVTWFSLDS